KPSAAFSSGSRRTWSKGIQGPPEINSVAEASMQPAKSPGPASFDMEAVLVRFEEAWRKGSPPEINQFMPADSAKDPSYRHLLDELLKIDLNYRWSRKSPVGKPWALEDYVRRLPEIGPLDQLSVELIGAEYWVRQRYGDKPSQQEYATRFPRYGSKLL